MFHLYSIILNIISVNFRRVMCDLIENYKVKSGLDEIEWTKSPLLRTNIDLTGPVQGVRCNRQRLRTETFKTKLRNNFERSVKQRHYFFINRVVPRWNKLSETVVSDPSLVVFKSVLDEHYKIFGFNGH